MSVHRLTPLPTRPARGRLVVTQSTLDSTRIALQAFRGVDGRHEGLVYWAGRQMESYSYVLTAIVPQCDHGPFRVVADERAIGAAARAARGQGLGLVGQVHSHPDDDTRHSDGDDQLVLMPFEGMFSLVVGFYGDGGILPEQGAGLHQYQSGRWVQIVSTDAAMVVVQPVEVLR
jgi:hypothetical protein